ncbi:MAG: DUF503 domain-containing protein [Dehalococcoidia bacterium]|nr:DUF503 domain-containing protein [Dehalococcoidia bacterium]
MTVGVLRLRFSVPADTLKEKRAVVKSVVERLRGRFNASVAEVEDLDDPGHATIAACVVSNDAKHADSMLGSIARTVEEWRLDVELLAVETELIEA